MLFRSSSLVHWFRSAGLVLLANVALVLCLSLFVSRAFAADGINRQINYQGKLSDTTGAAVVDGTYSIKFSLYDAASSGNRVWSASGTTATPVAMNVSIVNGLFTVLLGDTSLAGGSQNPLNDQVNWNSDNLYLGVTVASDSEMSPRKRLASTPYAFNAERLQGMYASGTTYGTSSLFVVNQTSETAASGTRSALEVRSSGMSDTNDYLIRGINSSSTGVFDVNRLGIVSTTGYFVSGNEGATSTFAGGVSSTRGVFDQTVHVNGKLVCLADGTNCQTSGGGSDANWTYTNATGTVRLTTSTNDLVLGNTGTSTAEGGAPVYFDLAGGTVGSSTVYFGHATQTNVVIGGTSTTETGLHSLFTMNGDDLLVMGNIGSVSSVYTNGAFVAGSGSMFYGAQSIVRADNGAILLQASSGTRMINSIDNSLHADTQFTLTASTTLDTGMNPVQSIERDGILYVLGISGAQGVYIYDVTTSTPSFLHKIAGNGAGVTSIDVKGRYLYLWDFQELRIFDISNPRNPLSVGSLSGAPSYCKIFVQGGYLYGQCGTTYKVYDISNPASPVEVGSLSVGGAGNDGDGNVVKGRYAYTTQVFSDIFRVVDVTNPHAPIEVYTSTTSAGAGPAQLALQGQYLYIANTQATDGVINVYDITSSTEPLFVANIVLGVDLSDYNPMVVAGRNLYIAAQNGSVYVYDIQNPASATLVKTITTNATTPNGLSIQGRRLNVLEYGGGRALQIYNTTGVETNAITANTTEFGQLDVQNDGFIGNRLDVMGSLNIGRGGLFTDGALTVNATGTTSTIRGALNITGGLFANGTAVCLSSGLNCQSSGGSTDLNWTYVGASGFVRNATSTDDIVFGNAATATADGGAPVYFDLDSENNGGSNVYFGHGTTTNVVLGGTAITGHGLHSLFTMNGNDLLVYGNIGSVSSVYTNGAFVAGTGSASYGAAELSVSAGTEYRITAPSGTQFLGGLSESWNSASPVKDLGYASVPFSADLSKMVFRYPYAFVHDNTYQYLHVFRISAPSSTEYVTSTPWSQYSLSGDISDIAVDGNTLVALNSKLHKFDVSDPSHPRKIASSEDNIGGTDVQIQGGYAYVAANLGANSAFRVVSLANTTPTQVGVVSGLNYASELVLMDRRVAVLHNQNAVPQQLSIFDVANPASPMLIAVSSTTETVQAHGIAAKDGYVYTGFDAATAKFKILVWDLQRPTGTQVVAEITTSAAGQSGQGNISIHGRSLYFVNESGHLEIFDISSSTAPYAVRTIDGGNIASFQGSPVMIGDLMLYSNASNRIGLMDLGGVEAIGMSADSGQFGSLRVLGPSVFADQLSIHGGLNVGYGGIFTDGVLSAALLNITATATVKNVDLLNTFKQQLSTSTFTQLSYATHPGDANIRVAVSGNYLALNRYTAGNVLLFDISDPRNVRQVSTTTIPDAAFPVAMSQNTIFTSNASYGPHYSIDMRNAKAPYIAATVANGSAAYSMDVAGSYLYATDDDGFNIFQIGPSSTLSLASSYTFGGSHQYNSVKVRDGFAYIAARNEHLIHIFDVSHGSSTFVGSLTGVTDIQQLAIREHLLYSIGAAELQIFDIRNPFEPVGLSTSTIGISSGVGIDVVGNTVFFADSNGIGVYDVTDAAAPRYKGRFGHASGEHQVVVQGKYLFETTSNAVYAWDIGGVDVLGMSADSGYIGRLFVGQDAEFANRVSIDGGLRVGRNGIYSEGSIQSGGFRVDAGGYITMASTTFGASSTAGTVLVTASSTSPVLSIVNNATYIATGTDGGEWGAYINSLLVGNAANATGSRDYAMVIKYNSNAGSDGLCISQSTAFCPYASSTQVVSIIADNPIVSDGFDLAETYVATGTTANGDVLEFHATASTTVQRSAGTRYSTRIAGVRSTDPGLILGLHGVNVALTGRVPTKFSPVNGVIVPGDPLTTSEYPGYAMKATKPGMIVGYALESASATSTIEMFVKVGFEARMAMGVDASGTIAQITDDFVVTPTSTATALNPKVSSYGLAFRGSSWNGATAINKDFTLQTDIVSSTNARFTIKNPSSTVAFSVDETGKAQTQGDLVVGGKLYPSGRGTAQTSKYVFLDDSSAPTSTYMATNADGWQANTSYDFAERYYSPDELEPGDLVVISRKGRLHVQRSFDTNGMLAGIVSTKPAFIAGAPATSTYPIALAGRVPTKVSSLNGAIKIGDWLAPSSIPGVAMKAIKAGPVVGQALDDYDSPEVGKIEAFVQATYWSGPEKTETVSLAAPVTVPIASNIQSGLAYMLAGQKSVKVTYPTVGSYPMIQVTPYREVNGGWWISSPTDHGFTLNFHQAQSADVVIAWSVTSVNGGKTMHVSDGTWGALDPTTGQLDVSTEPQAIPMNEPTEVPAPTLPPTSTSVDSIPEATPSPAPSPPATEPEVTDPGPEPTTSEDAPSTSL